MEVIFLSTHLCPSSFDWKKSLWGAIECELVQDGGHLGASPCTDIDGTFTDAGSVLSSRAGAMLQVCSRKKDVLLMSFLLAALHLNLNQEWFVIHVRCEVRGRSSIPECDDFSALSRLVITIGSYFGTQDT